MTGNDLIELIKKHDMGDKNIDPVLDEEVHFEIEAKNDGKVTHYKDFVINFESGKCYFRSWDVDNDN